MTDAIENGFSRRITSDEKGSTPLPDEINDSPIEEVRLTVPIKDDTTLPVLTFRTWVVGPLTCMFLSFLTEFLNYRQSLVVLSASSFTMLFFPIGKFMEAMLPTKPIEIPGTKLKFSMNPGPFNAKEHVLLSILATTGLDSPFSLSVVTSAKAFSHTDISFWGSFWLVLTSQMIGYGFAGMFMKFLVDSPFMWWPLSVVNVSFYRMLHDFEVRPRGKLTKLQFFSLVSVLSFAYHIIPNYLFPSIATLSFVCWIWRDSVTAQQIGSGLHGLGIGSFSLDWSTISGFLRNPLVMPMFAVINKMVGLILIMYIVVPIAYWKNSYGAKRFPVFSNGIFDANGQTYNVSRFVSEDLTLNQEEYDTDSVVYLSIFFVYSIAFQLAAETATITHFVLFHGRETWNQFKLAVKGEDQINDVHNRLMKKYDPVPLCWFYMIIVSMIALALLNSILFGNQFQLPCWGIMLGCFLAFVLTLPVGVICATTGQESMDMFSLSQLIMGLLYPGKRLGNLAFNSYCTTTLSNSIGFISEFKFAHYMKIPPKSLFIAQIVGALISYPSHFISIWWLLVKVKDICDENKLPKGSPWTCPGDKLLLSKSMIWGGVGPRRIFGPHSPYSKIYMFLLVGMIATVLVWIVSRVFPENKWLRKINVPLILGVGIGLPPAGALHFWSWFVVAITFHLVYRKYEGWWAKYNYLLANGLDMGVAFISMLSSLTFQLVDAPGLNWWGSVSDDHCPLATCPTASGIYVDGCPVFH